MSVDWRGAWALVLLLLVFAPQQARAQACCAGVGAATPGRLALHEDALLGLRMRAATVFGSFDASGEYRAAPPGSSEWDLEQDLVGALRVLPRGQVAALVPLVETYRATRGESQFGGGVGDVNLSARYDFVVAGESRWMPGVAAHAGV